jgi:hypothetical protein
LLKGPVSRESKPAPQALGYLLQHSVAPLTIEAVKGTGQPLVIGADDESGRPALGTDQVSAGFKFVGVADMGAGKMMNQAVVCDPGRPATRAALAKARQAVTLGAQLHSIDPPRLQNSQFHPLIQHFFRKTENELHRLRVELGQQVFWIEEVVGYSAKAPSNPQNSRLNLLSMY